MTGTGGDVLFIEATREDEGEGLTLTGQLGDVMKESAQIALSFVRSHADELGIDPAAHRPVPRPRARGCGSEGRTVRGGHDDDRAGLAAHRRDRSGRRRDDRRGHPARSGPADRRREAEGARRAPGGTHGGHPAEAERRRSGRRPGAGPRRDAVPPRRRRPGRLGRRARRAGADVRHRGLPRPVPRLREGGGVPVRVLPRLSWLRPCSS